MSVVDGLHPAQAGSKGGTEIQWKIDQTIFGELTAEHVGVSCQLTQQEISFA